MRSPYAHTHIGTRAHTYRQISHLRIRLGDSSFFFASLFCCCFFALNIFRCMCVKRIIVHICRYIFGFKREKIAVNSKMKWKRQRDKERARHCVYVSDRTLENVRERHIAGHRGHTTMACIQCAVFFLFLLYFHLHFIRLSFLSQKPKYVFKSDECKQRETKTIALSTRNYRFKSSIIIGFSFQLIQCILWHNMYRRCVFELSTVQ